MHFLGTASALQVLLCSRTQYLAGLVAIICLQQAGSYTIISCVATIYGREKLVWILSDVTNLSFIFAGTDGERYPVSLWTKHDSLYQDDFGLGILFVINLVNQALFLFSFLHHYFHLEVTRGPIVSKSGEWAMYRLLQYGKTGSVWQWGGYKRVQQAFTGRVIAARPLNSGLLYKEVEIKDRDFQAVVRDIAAAWDLEAEEIGSLVKEGQNFESSSDTWRLEDGDKLEFVGNGVSC